MLYNMINNTYESFSKEREMDFNGKVAVITGASSGIGLAIMKKFWEQGARTVNLDLADEVFGSDLFFKGDISDPEFLKECCEKTVERFGIFQREAFCRAAPMKISCIYRKSALPPLTL